MTPTPSSVARAREIVDTSVHVWRSENDGRLEDARLYEYLYNAIALALDAAKVEQVGQDILKLEIVAMNVEPHIRPHSYEDGYIHAVNDAIAAIREGKE